MNLVAGSVTQGMPPAVGIGRAWTSATRVWSAPAELATVPVTGIVPPTLVIQLEVAERVSVPSVTSFSRAEFDSPWDRPQLGSSPAPLLVTEPFELSPHVPATGSPSNTPAATQT